MSPVKSGTFTSIYNGLKNQQTYKPTGVRKAKQHSKVVCQTATRKAIKLYSSNSGHCFTNLTIQLILYLNVAHCSVFCLVTFFILCATGLTRSVLQHISASSHYPSLCISLLLSIYKSLSYFLLFISWHKQATTEFDPCGWLQRYCFVIINTACIYVKCRHDLWAHFS